jgi:hypothetical protein
MLKTITAGLLALLAAMAHAHAATITVDKFKDSDNSFVAVWGDIVEGDDKKLADALNNASIQGVLLNSHGGHFQAGLAMAKLVYERKLWTSVRKDWECTSACGFIWLAGSVRYYGPKTKIGFHSVGVVYRDKQGKIISDAVASNSGNALVGAFYNQLGLWDVAIVALTEAAPQDMFYLNKKRLEELGIKASLDDPDQQPQKQTQKLPPCRGC